MHINYEASHSKDNMTLSLKPWLRLHETSYDSMVFDDSSLISGGNEFNKIKWAQYWRIILEWLVFNVHGGWCRFLIFRVIRELNKISYSIFHFYRGVVSPQNFFPPSRVHPFLRGVSPIL